MLKKYRYDILIILIIAAVIAASFAAVFSFRVDTGKKVTVSLNGEETSSYPLDIDTTVRIDCGGEDYNLLIIENNEAWIEESNCKNQICVNSGRISKTGDMVVCLPHKMVIKIEE